MYFPHRNGVNGVQVPKVNPEGLFNPIIPQNLYSLGELNHLEIQCFLWDENEFRKKKSEFRDLAWRTEDHHPNSNKTEDFTSLRIRQ